MHPRISVVESSTPQFMEAVKGGNLKFIKDYTNNGGNLDVQDENGFTALHWAVDKGHIDIIRTLLDAGANINKTNKRGVTPLVLAAKKPQTTTAQVLLTFYRADTNIPDDSGETALHCGASYGDLSLVRVLLSKNTYIDLQTSGGDTALILAAWQGHTNVVQALIEAGANVNIANKNGSTALSLAAEHGVADVVRVLLDAGARTDTRNTNGVTPLIYAAWKGHAAIVQALLDAGADKTMPCHNGATPKTAATNEDVKRELQKHTVERRLHSFFNMIENRIEAVAAENPVTGQGQEEMNKAITLLLSGTIRILRLIMRILDHGRDLSKVPELIFVFSELMAGLSDKLIGNDRALQSYAHELFQAAAVRGHVVARRIVNTYQNQPEELEEEILKAFPKNSPFWWNDQPRGRLKDPDPRPCRSAAKC